MDDDPVTQHISSKTSVLSHSAALHTHEAVNENKRISLKRYDLPARK